MFGLLGYLSQRFCFLGSPAPNVQWICTSFSLPSATTPLYKVPEDRSILWICRSGGIRFFRRAANFRRRFVRSRNLLCIPLDRTITRQTPDRFRHRRNDDESGEGNISSKAALLSDGISGANETGETGTTNQYIHSRLVSCLRRSPRKPPFAAQRETGENFRRKFRSFAASGEYFRALRGTSFGSYEGDQRNNEIYRICITQPRSVLRRLLRRYRNNITFVKAKWSN